MAADLRTPYSDPEAFEEVWGHFTPEPAPVQQATCGGEDDEPLDGDFSDGDALVAGPPAYIREEHGDA
jgi:hypothetical protein